MPDTEVKKGFLNGVHAAVHWLMHIALLPEVWLLDGLGRALNYAGIGLGVASAWAQKIGADVTKIGADLDAL